MNNLSINTDPKVIEEKQIENHSSPEIRCINIGKSVKELGNAKTVILKNINLTINKGEIAIILGPSGSGKTTLLNVIAGIDKATEGECFIKDVDINKITDKNLVLIRRKYISYIYQRYGLIPILSCFDNIRMGQHLVEKSKRVLDINEIIKIVGIESLLEKFPHELSGGQRQRVAIARAIIKQPEIMLCDEPTGALDTETSKKIIDLFLKINQMFYTTIVMVTHDPSFVRIATKVIYIKDGEIEKIQVFKKNEGKNELVTLLTNSQATTDNHISTLDSSNESKNADNNKQKDPVRVFATNVKVIDSKLNKEESHVDGMIKKRIEVKPKSKVWFKKNKT